MRKSLVLAVLCGCLPALGWGPEGHRLVVRIAEAQLTPAARARVAAILGPERTLASIASWPDEIRRARPQTAGWHFVDIPIARPHFDRTRDCPKGNCVIARIEVCRQEVRDAALTPVQRAEALMFLVHFVGDMHQPLHSSDNGDKGGNAVPVLFHDKPSNLHSVWDSALLARMGAEDQLLAEFSRESARHAGKWSKGSVESWAEQAHRASQKVVYGRLPKTAANQPKLLNADYERRADRLIRDQIEKAGARLARTLNEAFEN